MDSAFLTFCITHLVIKIIRKEQSDGIAYRVRRRRDRVTSCSYNYLNHSIIKIIRTSCELRRSSDYSKVAARLMPQLNIFRGNGSSFFVKTSVRAQIVHNIKGQIYSETRKVSSCGLLRNL